MKILISFAFVCLFLSSFGQNENNAPLSEKAPTDKPLETVGSEQIKKYDEMIAPYVEEAKKTLPKAKKKFKKGLKPGQAFFLTTRIYDSEGNMEQIFVRVTSWNEGKVTGTIANELTAVNGFSFGQSISFPESAIMDWLISNPDGSEEGNFIGKYIDTLH